MKASELYRQLEKDFVKPEIKEDWYEQGYISDFEEYVCDNFKKRSIGLLCDFADEINKVYTAVFPSDAVLQKILDDEAQNAMLFLHHPAVWELGRPSDPERGFHPISTRLLDKLKERKISLFNFHLPLDNFGEYATSKNLAEAIGITIEKPFQMHNGALCGIIGQCEQNNIQELNKKAQAAIGHITKLHQYGESKITNKKIAIVAGGGNDANVVNDLISEGASTLITGISVANRYSAQAHQLEKSNKINLIGTSHYSSEKYACISICQYFKKQNLPANFIPDRPCLLDL